jgi:hypothetical protein
VTLLLSANLGDWAAIQVTDRRLTQDPGRRPIRRFDYANKQLVVLCEDAFLAVAYTGLARISGEPTDDWIARSLLHTDARLTFNFGGPTLPVLQFHEVYRRLRTALTSTSVAQQLRGKNRQLIISVVGLRRIRRTNTAEPFWATFRLADNQLNAWVSPKYRYAEKATARVDAFGSGSVIANTYINETLLARGVVDFADFEDYLAGVVRHVAEREPSVGFDVAVASVNTDPTVDCEASIRFVPRRNFEVVHDAYTPWILGPGFTMPPSATGSGGGRVGPYGYRVKIGASPKLDATSPVVLSVAPGPRPGPTLPRPGAAFPVTSEAIIESIRREHLRRLFGKPGSGGSSDAGRQTSIGDEHASRKR